MSNLVKQIVGFDQELGVGVVETIDVYSESRVTYHIHRKAAEYHFDVDLFARAFGDLVNQTVSACMHQWHQFFEFRGRECRIDDVAHAFPASFGRENQVQIWAIVGRLESTSLQIQTL